MPDILLTLLKRSCLSLNIHITYTGVGEDGGVG